MSVDLRHGDCLDVLRELPDASVDAVVTDPPYGLEFMGKEWDAPWQAGKGTGEHNAGFAPGAPAVPGVRGEIKSLPSYTGSTNPTCRNCGGTRNGNDRVGRRACRCNKPEFPNTTLPRMVAFQQWCETWAAECLRVLKPGGHLLAFGGTRTWHRLTCAIEDSGFEIRDSIAWMYGSGFPKSLDVSKAIDKAAGAEREVLRRRTDGVGNTARSLHKIEGFAASREQEYDETAPATDAARTWQGWGTALKPAFEPVVVARKPLSGTVAQTVLAHGTGALNIDGCRVGDGEGVVTFDRAPRSEDGDTYDLGTVTGVRPSGQGRWPANVVLDESQAAVLDEQSGESLSRIGKPRGADHGEGWGMTATGAEYDDQGGASRFFYVAKADASERVRVNGTAHPTVKPLALMRWLVRLVTPPGGTVLEPFAGSGTTVEACILEGFDCIAIEREADYLPLIRQRIARRRDPVEAVKATGDDGGLFDLLGGESA